MSNRRTHRPWIPAFIIAAACLHTARADDPPTRKTPTKPPSPAVLESAAGLKPIGGRWFLREGNPPTYVFKDAGTYVDLFSYHVADSNKDGIPNLVIRHDDQLLLIDSQGYPNHPTAIFPNSGNPNRIRVQDFHFRLPLEPKLASSITRVPMGPIGMALNGVVFFNPFEAGGMNAIEGYSEVWLDSCCGHPQQHGVYHYHKYPSCVKSPFADDGRRHSPVLGFAFDGFPVHGPFEASGVMARDLKGDRALDVCNGHTDPGPRLPLPCHSGPLPVYHRRICRRSRAEQQPLAPAQAPPGRSPTMPTARRRRSLAFARSPLVTPRAARPTPSGSISTRRPVAARRREFRAGCRSARSRPRRSGVRVIRSWPRSPSRPTHRSASCSTPTSSLASRGSGLVRVLKKNDALPGRAMSE